MDALIDEVESLEAILMEDVTIHRNDSGIPSLIETTVFPTVGEEVDSQYVCITLQVQPVNGYPDVKPIIKLKNPRGLDDHCINTIEAAVRQKLDESLGQPVVFDLIDIIREHLTESNLPTGQCVICLYGFQEGDEFTKTVCYHYLHSHCLACHLKASKRNYDEELAKMPVWKQKEAKPYQAQCPVCRESIEVQVEPLSKCRPPSELANAPRFQLTDELKALQVQMNRLYMHQKSRGGIIDLDAEEVNVISIETEGGNGEASKTSNGSNQEPSESSTNVSTTQKATPVANSTSHDRGQNSRHSGAGGANKNRSLKPQNGNVTTPGAITQNDNSTADTSIQPSHPRGSGGGHRHRRNYQNHRHHHHHNHHHGRGGGEGKGAESTSAAATTVNGGQKHSNNPHASGGR
ncbi:E3 ubiquitin-protein ligase RNF25 isoform X2 [Uranotaenia lowii]|uniref:E3 ubiquitin-protein ligase RNF25 isoform X2 n=1 Tax=Uranotaenia lowii TaxID=190385 RepID=UPI0024786777|nr:E3 ubiquitin-protein ligase RNF25 isoform X2 [Uranotaenia lowii]